MDIKIGLPMTQGVEPRGFLPANQIRLCDSDTIVSDQSVMAWSISDINVEVFRPYLLSHLWS